MASKAAIEILWSASKADLHQIVDSLECYGGQFHRVLHPDGRGALQFGTSHSPVGFWRKALDALVRDELIAKLVDMGCTAQVLEDPFTETGRPLSPPVACFVGRPNLANSVILLRPSSVGIRLLLGRHSGDDDVLEVTRALPRDAPLGAYRDLCARTERAAGRLADGLDPARALSDFLFGYQAENSGGTSDCMPDPWAMRARLTDSRGEPCRNLGPPTNNTMVAHSARYAGDEYQAFWRKRRDAFHEAIGRCMKTVVLEVDADVVDEALWRTRGTAATGFYVSHALSGSGYALYGELQITPTEPRSPLVRELDTAVNAIRALGYSARFEDGPYLPDQEWNNISLETRGSVVSLGTRGMCFRIYREIGDWMFADACAGYDEFPGGRAAALEQAIAAARALAESDTSPEVLERYVPSSLWGGLDWQYC